MGLLRQVRAEIRKRKAAGVRERCKTLLGFVREFWHVVEPVTPLVEGWVLEAICEHLEGVTYGFIQKLLINVPPGSMKSLLVNVLWPAWEWGSGLAHLRYVTFSYSASLTERDNRRFGAIVASPEYQEAFGDTVKLVKQGEALVSNASTGWKLATSVGGVGTGERGDRVILDDAHNVAQGESETVRNATVEWFSAAMLNRLNDMEKSAIVVVMQRLHEEDISGFILAKGLDFVHLMIPAEYEASRHCMTSIGWTDPRSEEGELYWPERFSQAVLVEQRRAMGPYAYSGQYQQRPTPKGGAIFKRAWWKLWESDTFPAFDFVMASLDPAYTEKQINDPSAMTVWGVWHENGLPRIMLIWAWRKRLEIIGPSVDPKREDETIDEFTQRQRANWGLVEWSIHTCSKRKVKAELLLIEAKASGISAAQTIRKLHANAGFGVQLIDPKGDKIARAYAVQPMFTEDMIYAPDRDWSDMVMTECEMFPKGKHDDLVDTVTQALRWLRSAGFAQRQEEISAEEMGLKMHKGREVSVPLYAT